MPSYLSPGKGPHVGPSHSWQGSKGFSGKLLPVISLNSQGEVKIKINKKFCQILVDIRAMLSTLNPTLIEQEIPKSKKGGFYTGGI